MAFAREANRKQQKTIDQRMTGIPMRTRVAVSRRPVVHAARRKG
jgi:hypothetical protein